MSTPAYYASLVWAAIFCAAMIWADLPLRQMLGAIGFPLTVTMLRQMRREYWRIMEAQLRTTSASVAPDQAVALDRRA